MRTLGPTALALMLAPWPLAAGCGSERASTRGASALGGDELLRSLEPNAPAISENPPPEPLGLELVFQSGHQGAVTAAAVSADGTLLATAEAYQPLLALWDLRSHLELRRLKLDRDAASLGFLPDGRLAVATTLSEVFLLDPRTGEKLARVANTLNPELGIGIVNLTSPLVVSPGGWLAAAGPVPRQGSGTPLHAVRVWSPESLRSIGAETLSRDDGGRGEVPADLVLDLPREPKRLAFAGDGHLAVGVGSGELLMFDIPSGQRACSTGEPSPRRPVSGLDAAPGGPIAVARGTTVAVVEPERCTLRFGVEGKAPVSAVAWAADGRLLVADRKGAVSAYRGGEQVSVDRLAPSSLSVVAPLPGRRAFVLAAGSRVALWGGPEAPLARLGSQAAALSEAIPLGKTGFLIGSAGELRYWPALSAPDALLVEGGEGRISRLVASRDGERALILYGRRRKDASLGLYHAGEARLRWRIDLPIRPERPRFSPDGRYVAVLGARREVVLFEAESGKLRARVPVAGRDDNGPGVVFDFDFLGPLELVTTGTFEGPPVVEERPDGTTVRRAAEFTARLDRFPLTTPNAVRLLALREIGPVALLAASPAREGGAGRVAFAYPEGPQAHALTLGASAVRSFSVNARAMGFSPSGEHLAVASGTGELVIVDVDEGKVRFRRPMSDSIMDRVSYRADGRQLVGGARDGVLRTWSIPDYRPRVAFFVRGGARLVLTPEGYYLGSRELMEAVAVRVGDRAHPFAQFDLALHRPDAVIEALGEGNPAMVRAYRAARRARLKRLGLERAPHPGAPRPSVRLADRSWTPVTDASQVRLRFRAEAAPEGPPLDRLMVRVDGVPIDGMGGRALPGRAAVRGEVQVELLPGRNEVDVSVLDAEGAESLPVRAVVERRGDGPPPSLVVVAIGVSAYRDPALRLDYAAKDARDVAALFTELGAEGRVRALVRLDEDATREGILTLRSELERTRPEDLVVFFVAGHGFLDRSFAYWFGTFDVDPVDPAARGIEWTELEALFDGIPARRRLFLLDTCHAGEADRDGPRTRVFASGARARSVGVARSVHRARSQAGGPSVSRLVDALFRDVRQTGATVLAASGGAEVAYESPRWKNGVLTFALREALGDGKGDLDQNGTTTWREVRRFVERRVLELTDGAQRPVLRRDNLASDRWVLVRREAE